MVVAVRLEDCTCQWLAEPWEYRTTEEEEIRSERSFTVLESGKYVRNVEHTLDINCPVHRQLMMNPPYLGKGISKVTSIAVDAVPLTQRDSRDDGIEMLVEQGWVVSRQTVSSGAESEKFGGQWSGNPGMTREEYEARGGEGSYFFVPLDDPRGEGHCRSCHHICQYESHIDANGHTYGCIEPTCGHWIGCPGC